MKNNTIKHWGVLIAASLMVGSAFGINLNINGVFLTPLAEQFQRPMAEISFFVTLVSMGLAFASFAITPIFERFGFKQIITTATIVTAGAMAFMGFASNIWILYILAAIRGFAAAFFGPVASQYLINNWFHDKLGMATSIVFSSGGFIGALASPLIASVINHFDVRAAFLIAAGLIVLLNLMGIFYNYTYRPEDSGLLPYGAELNDERTDTMNVGDKSEINTPVVANFKTYYFFVIIVIGLFIPGITALVQHLSPMAIDFNFSPEIGALLISVSMIANIVSKLVIGVIADARGVLFGKMTMLIAMIIGIVLLILHPNTFLMMIGAFGLGCVFSLSTVGLPLLTKRFYDDRAFSKVYPIVTFIANMGSALAISLYGHSYDMTQSYMPALWITLGLTIISLLLILSLNSHLKNHQFDV